MQPINSYNFTYQNSSITNKDLVSSIIDQHEVPALFRTVFHVMTLPFQWIGQGIQWICRGIQSIFRALFSCFYSSSTNPYINEIESILKKNENKHENILGHYLRKIPEIFVFPVTHAIGQGVHWGYNTTKWTTIAAFRCLFSFVSSPQISTPISYKNSAQFSTGSRGNYTNDDMLQIWKQTEKILQQGSYKNSLNKTQNIQAAANRAVYNTEIKGKNIQSISDFKPYVSSNNQPTEISIWNKDAIEVAIELSKKGNNIVLLNPANASTPGGGYLTGARAMEEDICRRSALAYCLDTRHGKQLNEFYPFSNPNQVIYSRDVPIFRSGRDDNYALLEEVSNISIISSAAININSAFIKTVLSDQVFYEETMIKIYNQLLAAAEQGHDSIVLTAFGCGAFCNPPEKIAAMYQIIIQKYFKGVFKKIVFAIIDDHNTGQAHNPKGNFQPFATMVKKMGGTKK